MISARFFSYSDLVSRPLSYRRLMVSRRCSASPPAPAPAAPAAEDAEQRLTTLKRLYDKGLITKSEYEKKRQEILKSL